MPVFRSLATAALVVAVALVAPAASAMEIRTELIEIPRGEPGTQVSGMVTGAEFIEYLLPVLAGQEVSIALSSSSRALHMGIAEPGGRREVFDGAREGAKFDGRADQAGDYRIRVRLAVDGVARNERARFVLTVASVRPGATRPQPQQPGREPGREPGRDPGRETGRNPGEPEFWQVTGVGARDTLNIRSGPNTGNPVVARVPEGEVLRNLGCYAISGQRWCQVERVNGRDGGWASATYLREASLRPGRPGDDRPGRPTSPTSPTIVMEDGGPDFWQVTGIGGRDYLNVRSGPGTGHPIVARLSDGDVLRNLGCGRLPGDRQRWCEVERRNGQDKGWVAGDFLREASVRPAPPIADRPTRPDIGGPDIGRPGRPERQSYFEVTGLSANGLLNVRGGPGTQFPVLGRVANGDVLIDRGCRAVGGQTWCRIELMNGEDSGWVSATYVRQTRLRQGRSRWR